MRYLLPVSLSAFLIAGGVAFAQTAGSAGQGATMSDAQITQQLQAQGYSNVKITDHDKDHVDVTASKGGKTQKLAVDPRTGRASPDTDKD